MADEIRRANERSVEAFREFGGEIKHAARHRLWLPEALSLKKRKGKFLRYFTLSGKWAYDVFFMEQNEIIARTPRGFPDVRFCDNNPNFFATAKCLLGNTVGIQSNFETAVLDDRPEFWGGFPYDIYNLDFCGTCFPDDQPPFSNTFRAITKIIHKHALACCSPFLVFLTMKALPEETNAEACKELMDNIEANRAEPAFRQALTAAIPNTGRFVEENFCDFITVSIPKLVCFLARDQCNVDVRQRAKYQRKPKDGESYFIAKFVFRFDVRPQKSLCIVNTNYVENVLKIIQLNHVVTIDKKSVTKEVRKSLARIRAHLTQSWDSGAIT
jgi:hypothetical protein